MIITKFVYVLVSSSSDIYLEQAYISMFSLKYFMPDAIIVLLTDSATVKSFTGIREKEIQYADEIIAVDLDAGKLTAQQRSRQLKTSVRNKIEGDFLFIDCDTIVVKPLYEVDTLDYDIAACRDTHTELATNPYRDMHLYDGHQLGWPIDEEKDYFNTGIMFVKDSPLAHEYYRRWNENLNSGYPKKVFMDQPSFAKTNYEMGHVVKHLPDIWNCELKHGIKYLKDAKIVHYLCTNTSKFQDKQLFLLNEKDCLLEVKRTGCINDEIKVVILDPFKGLADVTHCFSGEDIFYFRTRTHEFFRSFFKMGKKTILEKLILFGDKIKYKLQAFK